MPPLPVVVTGIFLAQGEFCKRDWLAELQVTVQTAVTMYPHASTSSDPRIPDIRTKYGCAMGHQRASSARSAIICFAGMCVARGSMDPALSDIVRAGMRDTGGRKPCTAAS